MKKQLFLILVMSLPLFAKPLIISERTTTVQLSSVQQPLPDYVALSV